MLRVYLVLLVCGLVGFSACNTAEQGGEGEDGPAEYQCPEPDVGADVADSSDLADSSDVADSSDATDVRDAGAQQPEPIKPPQIATPRAELVWPLSGTERPLDRLSSTFGPRLKISEAGRYDFHRGIDLPAPPGTPIRAVAAGTVRLAGEHPEYQDPVIQVEHRAEAGQVFYSTYIHVASWEVTPGQQVAQGDVIGTTGVSESGFEHLHFEIREGDFFEHNCVHPLLYLPYANKSLPEVVVEQIDQSQPRAPKVSFSVELPFEELDLERIAVGVSDADTGELVDTQHFAMTRLNHLLEDRAVLDNPAFQPGLYIAPARFSSTDERYRITFTFDALAGAAQNRFVIAAEDVFGNRTTQVVEAN